MQVSVNGEVKQTESTTLQALMDEYLQQSEKIKMAVAVNGQVVLRQRWSEYQLNANDVIDVVQAVAGG